MQLHGLEEIALSNSPDKNTFSGRDRNTLPDKVTSKLNSLKQILILIKDQIIFLGKVVWLKKVHQINFLQQLLIADPWNANHVAVVAGRSLIASAIGGQILYMAYNAIIKIASAGLFGRERYQWQYQVRTSTVFRDTGLAVGLVHHFLFATYVSRLSPRDP